MRALYSAKIYVEHACDLRFAISSLRVCHLTLSRSRLALSS